MFFVPAGCKRADARPVAAIGSAVDLLKTHKLPQLKHVRFLVFLILLLGLLSTVPTEFFVEVSVISGRLGAKNPSPAAAKFATQQKDGRSTQLNPYIQDVVLLPEDVLLLVRLPSRDFRFSDKEKLSCVLRGTKSSKVRGLEYVGGERAAIRCSANGAGVGGGKLLVREAALEEAGKGEAIAGSGEEEAKLWSLLVFEVVLTEEDVVLFAKGINTRQRRSIPPHELICVFGEGAIHTRVTVSSQEVFRCEHPPLERTHEARGMIVTLLWEQQLVPSVAYYEPTTETTTQRAPKVNVCMCTMVHNVAKFLHEWVMYHSHLGVQKFVLYDNNSDDEIDELVDSLDRYINVTKHPWPWPKSQEAGFSHCALWARDLCHWMLFIDVDEFLFPLAWLKSNGAPLQTMIETLENKQPQRRHLPSAPSTQPIQTSHASNKHLSQSASNVESLLSISIAPVPHMLPSSSSFHHNIHTLPQVDPPLVATTTLPTPSSLLGQIHFNCREFGPSGLSHHPIEGVTQGYTCRRRLEERHKSIVKLEALSLKLLTVVHHFELQKGYKSLRLDSSMAVVNHYKFQAWEEFRQKFRQRVSAYVVDWKEPRNLKSRDRTPGLGFREAKPPNWETSFCDVPDTALRDYARHIFSVNISGVSLMTWQLPKHT